MPMNTKVAPTMLARFTGWRTASIAPRSWSATESIRTEGVGVMTNQPTSAKGSAAEYRVKVTRQSKSWVTPPEISGSTARPVVSTAELRPISLVRRSPLVTSPINTTAKLSRPAEPTP